MQFGSVDTSLCRKQPICRPKMALSQSSSLKTEFWRNCCEKRGGCPHPTPVHKNQQSVPFCPRHRGLLQKICPVHYRTPPGQGRDLEKDWIDDWFPSEEVDEKNPNKRKRRRRKREIDEDIPDDEVIVGPPSPPEDLSHNHSWDLDKIAGGFSVSGAIKHGVDYVFTIKMGYSRDDGTDPIKKWKNLILM